MVAANKRDVDLAPRFAPRCEARERARRAPRGAMQEVPEENDAPCLRAGDKALEPLDVFRRRARAEIAVQVLERAMLAARAVALVVGAGDLELPHAVRPEVEAQHRRRNALEVAGQDLERLGGFEARDDLRGRSEHADRVAGRAGAGRRRLLEQTPEARRRVALAVAAALPCGVAARGVRQNRERRADGADRAAVDVRSAVLHGAVVQEVTRLEVVDAVEQDVRAGREPLGVARIEVVDDRRDLDARIDPRELAFGGFGFRHGVADVLLVVEHLTLKIRELDEVAIDEEQAPDAGPRERVGDRRAERAAADDRRGRVGEPALPRLAEAGEQHLPVITLEIRAHVMPRRARCP